MNGPPLGPVLGQYGISGPTFCQQFNDVTAGLDDFDIPMVLPTRVVIYDDRSVGFFVKKPTVGFLLKIAAVLTRGDNGEFFPALSLSALIHIAR